MTLIKKLIKNIIGSFNHISYTYYHIKAFNKLQIDIFGYKKYRFHDWDKIAMYILIPYIGTKNIKCIHKKISKHHLNYCDTNWDSLEEALIDWESAQYSKKDKPANAYTVIYAKDRCSIQTGRLLSILKTLNFYNKTIKLEKNV